MFLKIIVQKLRWILIKGITGLLLRILKYITHEIFHTEAKRKQKNTGTE